MESFRSTVSSRWPAMSRTIYIGAIVCSSHSSGVSDLKRSISFSSILRSRGVQKIGSGPVDSPRMTVSHVNISERAHFGILLHPQPGSWTLKREPCRIALTGRR